MDGRNYVPFWENPSRRLLFRVQTQHRTERNRKEGRAAISGAHTSRLGAGLNALSVAGNDQTVVRPSDTSERSAGAVFPNGLPVKGPASKNLSRRRCNADGPSWQIPIADDFCSSAGASSHASGFWTGRN